MAGETNGVDDELNSVRVLNRETSWTRCWAFLDNIGKTFWRTAGLACGGVCASGIFVIGFASSITISALSFAIMFIAPVPAALIVSLLLRAWINRSGASEVVQVRAKAADMISGTTFSLYLFAVCILIAFSANPIVSICVMAAVAIVCVAITINTYRDNMAKLQTPESGAGVENADAAIATGDTLQPTVAATLSAAAAPHYAASAVPKPAATAATPATPLVRPVDKPSAKSGGSFSWLCGGKNTGADDDDDTGPHESIGFGSGDAAYYANLHGGTPR